MKTHNNVVTAGALALALSLGLALPGVAQAAGTTILTEGFDDINALEGWAQFNGSYPQGQGWFQGVASTFAAQGGAGNSYAASNFLGADAGVGFVDNWLISPLLQLTGTTVLSFFSRGAGTAGYSDQLEVRFDDGNGDFNTLLTTVGGVATYPSSWTAYSASLSQEGSGRFAFRYLGDADALDYIGVDTVSVMTAVPEPSSWLMLVLGLAGVGALRRKFS
jgi:hypothetical protein